MPFQGADTDSIRTLETQLRAGAEDIDRMVREAVNKLEAAPWSGPDRDRAVVLAQALLRRTRTFHEQLQRRADDIRSHADEQDRVSEPDVAPTEMANLLDRFSDLFPLSGSGELNNGMQNWLTFGSDDFDPLDWVVGTAEEAAGWAWDNIGVPVVNGLASLGQAMIDNPAATGTTLLGLGMMAVGATGEGVGIALLPTGLVSFGAGTAAGGAVMVGSAELVAAGAAVTAVGGGILLSEAVGNPQTPASRREPQTYQPSSGSGSPRPPREVLDEMPPGRNPGVRTAGNDSELQVAYDQMARGGEVIRRPGYRGEWVRQPDGTEIGLRESSSSGGRTIDVRHPDGTTEKVHIS